ARGPRRGTAWVPRVSPSRSAVRLELDGGTEPAADDVFKAVFVSSPAERLAVRLCGDEAALSLVRTALDRASPSGPSLYVREAEQGEPPGFVLTAQGDRYLISRPADDRPLVQPLSGYAASAMLAVRRLEHIARWQLTLELANPASTISPGDVLVEVDYLGKQHADREYRLQYREEDGRLVQPQFKVRVTNK